MGWGGCKMWGVHRKGTDGFCQGEVEGCDKEVVSELDLDG